MTTFQILFKMIKTQLQTALGEATQSFLDTLDWTVRLMAIEFQSFEWNLHAYTAEPLLPIR
jgi:hypothetical protein